MNTAWSIDGEDLNTKPRTGGVTAEKGFNFQKAYALVRLTWLPTGERGLVELRYEGAQDIDLRFEDGLEVLIQAKDYKPGNFTYSTLKDVIAGFTRDLITAANRGRKGADAPRFRLVCTSAPHDEISFEILRSAYISKHAEAIEPLIQDDYRDGLNRVNVIQWVQGALENSNFEIIFHDHAIDDLKAQASWNLVKFGVPPECVQSSIANLLSALVPRAKFQVSDVVKCLEGLPEYHPAHIEAACRLLPASGSLEMTELMRKAFLRGASHSLWTAIANGLDVKRAESTSIENALNEIQISGGMVIVEGGSGTGKSALVRRIAWDAHRTGTHIVLEVIAPNDVKDENWSAMLHLLQLSQRPLLLIVDDVLRHEEFVASLERRIRPNLCVLATSRPNQSLQSLDNSVLPVHSAKLGKLSPELVDSLRDQLSSIGAVVQVPPGHITRFMEYGQLLALSLTLQGGTLHDFAKSILIPLRHSSALIDFLDLCVAGQYDLTAPLTLFERLRSEGTPFWRDERFFGLVSIQESKTGPSRLKVGHSIVAQAIVMMDEIRTLERTIYLCNASEPGNLDERRFVIRLFNSALKDPKLKEHSRRKGVEFSTAVKRLLGEASFSDAHRLSAMLKLIGQSEVAHQFLEAATADRVRDAVDVGLALSLKDDFDSLYPHIFEFYECNPAAPGRRRFLRLTGLRGTPERQISVILQTANWAAQYDYPADETLALLKLGGYASDTRVVKSLEPTIWSYLKGTNLRLDILFDAVMPTRRISNDRLSQALIASSLKLVNSIEDWQEPHIKLVRHLAFLASPENEIHSRPELGLALLKALSYTKSYKIRIKVIKNLIVVGALETQKPLSDLIREIQKLSLQDGDILQKQFLHRFK